MRPNPHPINLHPKTTSHPPPTKEKAYTTKPLCPYESNSISSISLETYKPPMILFIMVNSIQVLCIALLSLDLRQVYNLSTITVFIGTVF